MLPVYGLTFDCDQGDARLVPARIAAKPGVYRHDHGGASAGDLVAAGKVNRRGRGVFAVWSCDSCPESFEVEDRVEAARRAAAGA